MGDRRTSGGEEIEYGEVLRAVERFLRRYHDAFTCAHRDDLAQEAAIETWRRSASLRDAGRATAFARTIARRLRYQAVHRNLRARAFRSLDREVSCREALAVREPGEDDGRAFRVGGEWVDAAWFSEQLDDVLLDLGSVNRAIVRAYYEGSSCRELGARYGIAPAGVKARLHRCRIRIRESFVARFAACRTACAGRSRAVLSSTTGGGQQ